MRHRSEGTIFYLAALLALAVFTGCPDQGVGDDDDTTAADDDDTCDAEPLDVGIYQRTEAAECPAERAAVLPVPQECSDYPDTACSSHEDCTDGANGRCTTGLWGTDDCGCTYDECFTDADCGPGQMCGCGEGSPFEQESNNRCYTAECLSDADCDSGLCLAVPFYCDVVFDVPYVVAFACATDQDECRNHDVCECDEGADTRCSPSGTGGTTGPWTCNTSSISDCD